MIKYQFKAKNWKQNCNKYNILIKYFKFIVWIFWKEVISGEKKWKKNESGQEGKKIMSSTHLFFLCIEIVDLSYFVCLDPGIKAFTSAICFSIVVYGHNHLFFNWCNTKAFPDDGRSVFDQWWWLAESYSEALTTLQQAQTWPARQGNCFVLNHQA